MDKSKKENPSAPIDFVIVTAKESCLASNQSVILVEEPGTRKRYTLIITSDTA